MARSMEKKFARDFDSLDDVFEFVDEYVEREAIAETVTYAIKLAVEELFTNMVKYNTGTKKRILLRMNLRQGSLVAKLIDFDVEPFDPKTVKQVVVDTPMDLRKPGGLGLHLVRSVVDKISYEYRNRRMTVTIIKKLES